MNGDLVSDSNINIHGMYIWFYTSYITVMCFTFEVRLEYDSYTEIFLSYALKIIA